MQDPLNQASTCFILPLFRCRRSERNQCDDIRSTIPIKIKKL